MDAERRAHIISLIDLTNLDDDCSAADVDELCSLAIDHGTAAVCIWPVFVSQAALRLANSAVEVATVVNFPTGDDRIYTVDALTESVLNDGANEIEIVLPYRRFLAGDARWCVSMLERIRLRTDGRAAMKVILETGALGGLVTIRQAANLAIACGADFLKTSTGKSTVSATPTAVQVMAEVIADADRGVGLKPSGGIRTGAEAANYLDITESVLGEDWTTLSTFRFGASSLLTALTTESHSTLL